MSVLLCLIIAPLGLLVILGMSWFEDHVLRPPTSPADQVVRSQGLPIAPAPAPGPVLQGTVELLRIVRAPQAMLPLAPMSPVSPLSPPTAPPGRR
jgi:hypothetical protein